MKLIILHFAGELKTNLFSLYTPVRKNGYSFHLRTGEERAKNNIENIFNNVSESKLCNRATEVPKNKSDSNQILSNHKQFEVDRARVKCNLGINEEPSEQSNAPILPPKSRVTPKLPPKPFFSVLKAKQNP